MADNKEALPVVRIKRWSLDKAAPGMFDSGHGGYVKFSDHEAALSELRAEVERLRKYAERYRWLRDGGDTASNPELAAYEFLREPYDAWPRHLDGAELDAAIDTARSAASGESAEGGV